MPENRSENARERVIRRWLACDGERLWKVRPGRFSAEHGPYAVIDENNCLRASGCTLDSLEAEMRALKR